MTADASHYVVTGYSRVKKSSFAREFALIVHTTKIHPKRLRAIYAFAALRNSA
ncbi:MAG: hypothetical protein ACREOZ_05360 [Gloeomargaritales cyanobacterium]